MPNLGQNLGQNLGVNLSKIRANDEDLLRLAADLQWKREHGFSPDGLSYSVADDFSKLASQALADYEARIKNPRIDIWGRTLQEDTPAALDAELFQPLRSAFGAPTQTVKPPRIVETPTGIVSIDPETLETTKVMEYPEKEKSERRYNIPTSVDAFGGVGGSVSLTIPELAAMAPSLPDQIRTNAPVAPLLELYRQSSGTTSTNRLGPSPTLKRRVFNPQTGRLE